MQGQYKDTQMDVKIDSLEKYGVAFWVNKGRELKQHILCLEGLEVLNYFLRLHPT